MKKLVFTGGHHTSALEVAIALQKEDWQIIWFGHRHSLWGDSSDSAEYREVTAAGFKFCNLYAGKFYRTYNPLKLILIPVGFLQSLLLLLLHRPDGIVSFGGYLAVPTVISGWLLGIPSITHEQTVVAGLANKLISYFVKKIAVSWPESIRYYPKDKTIVTGLPIRPEIITASKSQTRNLIYITGGKNGSHVINKAVFSALPKLLKKYQVIHQTGFRDIKIARSIKHANYETFDYDSAKAINSIKEAAVVISRAGAHITYELGVLSKRCVLIPIPWVSHNEQLKNAQALSSQAIILPQNLLSPSTLVSSIKSALALHPVPLNLPLDGTKNLLQLIKEQFT
ncbi:MAG: iron compound ABC transporter ATP-binding protein [Microgenomates group bacterium Gr01-1014_16]|nr:MAG: iron compound ABC transporter ATP-binding protein [Microgenomates group bacterium Gr01-1014_16]